MRQFLALLSLLSVTPFVHSHGIILSPPPRRPGPATLTACGTAITTLLTSDPTAPIEYLTKAASTDPTHNATQCNLFLCKGLQFADMPASLTYGYTGGASLALNVSIRIPHEGRANMSIVDTRSNQIVNGDEGMALLRVWEKGYAPGKTERDVPVEQREFEIRIPRGLEKTCAKRGDCVLQWWWYGTAAKQTYESCVDFYIDG